MLDEPPHLRFERVHVRAEDRARGDGQGGARIEACRCAHGFAGRACVSARAERVEGREETRGLAFPFTLCLFGAVSCPLGCQLGVDVFVFRRLFTLAFTLLRLCPVERGERTMYVRCARKRATYSSC